MTNMLASVFIIGLSALFGINMLIMKNYIFWEYMKIIVCLTVITIILNLIVKRIIKNENFADKFIAMIIAVSIFISYTIYAIFVLNYDWSFYSAFNYLIFPFVIYLVLLIFNFRHHSKRIKILIDENNKDFQKIYEGKMDWEYWLGTQDMSAKEMNREFNGYVLIFIGYLLFNMFIFKRVDLSILLNYVIIVIPYVFMHITFPFILYIIKINKFYPVFSVNFKVANDFKDNNYYINKKEKSND